jgi:hypothetical protein
MGDVLCFSNTAKLNVIRGMWPFCLFWFVALLYLWIASEPGRRARGYLHRQTSNVLEHLKDTFHGQETASSAESGSSSASAGPSDEEVAQQPSNSDPPVEGGTITDTEQPVSTSADSVVPSSSPTDAETTTNTRTIAASLASESHSSEFGSRANYVHLLKELYSIHRYEPERMYRLRHSAWHRERRRHEEDQIQQRQQGQLQQQLQGEQQPSPVEQGFAVVTRRPWWTAQPTIKLSLKTKRFEDDDVEENVDNDGEDSLEEGGKEKTCAICLAEIEHGDVVGDIPCHHLFHKDCLKSWIQRSNRCPLCQKEGIAFRRQPVALPPPDANGEEE